MPINERWRRNQKAIQSIERAIERNKGKIAELEDEEGLYPNVREAKILDLVDLNMDLKNEIENLKKSFEELLEEGYRRTEEITK